MKTKQGKVVRWMIWFQVAVFVVVSISTLADFERIPEWLLPPQWLLVFCAFAMWIVPLTVIAVCFIKKSEQNKLSNLVISVLIAVASVWAFLPLIQ